MTLNRVRAADQRRRLVQVDANGVATAVPKAVVDATDLAGATTRGRLVVNETAAPHDGDAYSHPKPPPPEPGP
jgi:hypothetical protein